MSTLFESINGTKCSKEYKTIVGDVIVHMMPVNKLNGDPGKYDRKLKNLYDSIHDQVKHVCIIFNNSIVCENYDGYVYYKRGQNFQYIDDQVLEINNRKYVLRKNGNNHFLSMLDCWGITFSFDDTEIEALACCYKNKPGMEIEKEYNAEIDLISRRLNLSPNIIIARIRSSDIDYYKYTKTFEYDFYRSCPLINELANKPVQLYIYDNWTENALPSLIDLLQSYSCTVAVDGTVSKFINLRFNVPSIFTVDNPETNYIVISKDKDRGERKIYDLLNSFPEETKHRVFMITHSNEKIANASDFGEKIVCTYEPIINHPQTSKIIKQDDYAHATTADGMQYFSLICSPFKAKVYEFARTRGGKKINNMYSLKYLRKVARIMYDN